MNMAPPMPRLSAGQALGLGAGTLALGASAISAYDTYKSRGHGGAVRAVRGLLEQDRVSVREYVARVDPSVYVIDSESAARASLAPAIEGLIRAQEGPNASVDSAETEMAAVELWRRVGSNPAVLATGRGSYLVCPPQLPAAAIEHELGHIRDFRAKGITIEDPDGNLYRQNPILQRILKSYYQAGAYGAEANAWGQADLSGAHPSRGPALQDAAMQTYDTMFHRRRARIAGAAAGTLGSAALLAAAYAQR
jgi:hypothetical protein